MHAYVEFNPEGYTMKLYTTTYSTEKTNVTQLRLNGVGACLNPLPKIIGTNRREYNLPDELVLIG